MSRNTEAREQKMHNLFLQKGVSSTSLGLGLRLVEVFHPLF